MDVYIDGSKVANVDESGAGKWQQTWTSDAYPAGTHTVRLVHATGYTVDIDAVQINSTVTILGSGSHDDADPAWLFSSNWQVYSGSGPYGGTLHSSGNAGDTAQVSFTGGTLILTYTQMPTRGSVEVYLDGTKIATVNESGVSQWQQSWTSASFTSGLHTVRFKNISAVTVDVDAITITP